MQSTKKVLLGQNKREAERLIVKEGLSQKDVAKQLKVSQKTIGGWAKKFTEGTPLENITTKTKYTKAELRTLRNEAARLVIHEGLMQKEVCARFGISRKTMSGWAKAGGWRTAANKVLIGVPNKTYALSDFAAYLAGQSKEQYDLFNEQWNRFISASNK